MRPIDEITVTIKDFEDRTFSKDWKNTTDKRKCIRWTLEHGDLPYHVDIANIVEITVK